MLGTYHSKSVQLEDGRPPYGYRKQLGDTKEIVPVVQRIFELCTSGKGANQIARILTSDKVLTPTNCYYQKYGTSHRYFGYHPALQLERRHGHRKP